jgi:hypothetical protein
LQKQKLKYRKQNCQFYWQTVELRFASRLPGSRVWAINYFTSITEVLGSRPKLLGSICQVRATLPNTPNKKKSNGEGQRKEVYYETRASAGRERYTSQCILPVRIFA